MTASMAKWLNGAIINICGAVVAIFSNLKTSNGGISVNLTVVNYWL